MKTQIFLGSLIVALSVFNVSCSHDDSKAPAQTNTDNPEMQEMKAYFAGKSIELVMSGNDDDIITLRRIKDMMENSDAVRRHYIHQIGVNISSSVEDMGCTLFVSKTDTIEEFIDNVKKLPATDSIGAINSKEAETCAKATEVAKTLMAKKVLLLVRYDMVRKDAAKLVVMLDGYEDALANSAYTAVEIEPKIKHFDDTTESEVSLTLYPSMSKLEVRNLLEHLPVKNSEEANAIIASRDLHIKNMKYVNNTMGLSLNGEKDVSNMSLLEVADLLAHLPANAAKILKDKETYGVRLKSAEAMSQYVGPFVFADRIIYVKAGITAKELEDGINKL